jgi:hypothetical protein
MTTINKKRKTLKLSHVGEQVTLTISGDRDGNAGTFIAADPAKNQPFDKIVYSVRASSILKMSNPANRELFTKGVQAESAGNLEEAHEYYQQYLNAIQMSFNVIAGRGRQYRKGDAIKAKLILVDTKSGSKALALDEVEYQAPIQVEATEFDVTDLISTPAVSKDEILDPSKVIS